MFTRFTVEGMHCAHCVNAVTKAVLAVPAVQHVDVDLTTKLVAITHENATITEIIAAIEDQGFDVTTS